MNTLHRSVDPGEVGRACRRAPQHMHRSLHADADADQAPQLQAPASQPPCRHNTDVHRHQTSPTKHRRCLAPPAPVACSPNHSRHETMSTESTRPLLLPQNRKLRHLRGLALRNLAFSRPRGRTIDDAALNKSPAKLESLRNTPRLHHALSSEALRPPTARRRSTNLANASPATRQKQFEETFDTRLADAFFSLHVEGQEEPIYISEVEERATVRLRSRFRA